ncbi:hypothetical protein AS850_02945 [Frondihabitans sp. 762G35]|uniref:hypothetical protein n=1 Tax=Frondihabitans sp. 762G35 TaxID=1446794 RepID=UPI000D212DB3|nr:hypothetical protein [Frondihabitans sp. 762G35]ARC56030.1 hypothetical protein AS850_02945 [Frondihabitans sp. 762G35]
MIQSVGDTLARGTDPQESQDAAAAVGVRLSTLKVAVLELVALKKIAGSVGNQRYKKWQPLYGWPRAAEDTPRKRMGELASMGFLRVTRMVKGPNGKREAEYEITQYGRDYLKSVTG